MPEQVSPPGASQERRAASPADDLDRLRAILKGAEEARIEELEARLDDPAHRAREIGRVLPEAIRQRQERDDRLAKALAPTIDEAVAASVRKDPRPLADALFPVIGPAIRKAIVSTLHGMLQAFNQALEQSLSLRSIRWRLEALRTGEPFSEVILLHTLHYRVEEVFLIHRETGLLLLHETALSTVAKDADLISGMLTAIRDFVTDSFGAGAQDSLETFQVGELTVLVEQGPTALMALVIRGEAPADLKPMLQEAIEQIHLQYGEVLEGFAGDATPFENGRPILQDCLVSQYERPGQRPSALSWLVLGLLLALPTLWAFAKVDESRRWDAFMTTLKEQPGIAVTEAVRQNGSLSITGFRDPLAIEPRQLLRQSGLGEKGVVFHWQPYQALHPPFILTRAETVLEPPETVSFTLEEGVLRATGDIPEQWAADAARLARLIPGIEAFRAEVDTLRQLIAMIGRQRLFFETGETALKPGQEEQVRSISTLFKRLDETTRTSGRKVRIEVLGHTDRTGPEDLNWPLSQKRAEAILAALAAEGVDTGDFRSVAMGPLQARREGVDPQQLSVTFKVRIDTGEQGQ